MAVYHMDTDACRSLQTNMVTLTDQITESMNKMSGAMSGMVGTTWIAPAANESLNTFNEKSSSAIQQGTQLGDLAKRLSQTIAAWEEVAARF